MLETGDNRLLSMLFDTVFAPPHQAYIPSGTNRLPSVQFSSVSLEFFLRPGGYCPLLTIKHKCRHLSDVAGSSACKTGQQTSTLLCRRTFIMKLPGDGTYCSTPQQTWCTSLRRITEHSTSQYSAKQMKQVLPITRYNNDKKICQTDNRQYNLRVSYT